MRRLFVAAIALIWLSAQVLASRPRDPTVEPHFQPAAASAIGNVSIPFNSIAIRTVVLDVGISVDGTVRGVQVRRDIASITEEAVRSIKAWKFDPARLNGKPVASRVTVAVTFNPAPPLCANIPLPPMIPPSDRGQAPPSPQPPEVTRATFPACLNAATGPGTVILEASIDPSGKVQHTKVLGDGPPFTAAAIKVVDGRRFKPATSNGSAVESKAILVFCFRPPPNNWP